MIRDVEVAKSIVEEGEVMKAMPGNG